MFTGIVEEIGCVRSIRKTNDAYQFQIACTKILEDVHIGDSIAVNGVCLTVNTFTDESFTVDVMPETVKATTIETLKIGSCVNLERAMAANGRFGGHFVSGHIDGTGEIKRMYREGNALCMEIHLAGALRKYVIDKGSIAVDGTSLTIFHVTTEGFVLSLIPVTQQQSVIGMKRVGDMVNIECDVLMKQIDHLLHRKAATTTSTSMYDTLAKSGFLS